MKYRHRRTAAPSWKGTAIVLLYLVFSVSAVLPSRVFCARDGGRTVVEFQPFDGVCQCGECEHCLQASLNPHARDGRTGFRPCHCRHEAFDSELGHGSSRLPEALDFPGGDRIGSVETLAPPRETGFFVSLAAGGRERAGPDSVFTLRC